MRRHPVPLPRHRRAVLVLRAVLAAGGAGALAGCGRDAPPPRADTTVAVSPAPPPDSVPSAPPVDRLTWDVAGAGPALFVPGDTAEPSVAFTVLPEIAPAASDSALAAATTPLDGAALDLFALGGRVGVARVAADARDAYADAGDCAPWPSVRLRGGGRASTPAAGPAAGSGASSSAPEAGRLAVWRVAFTAGHASGIAVDSIEGLTGADSAARVADVARLASLPPRTNTKEFGGLPFTVRRANRFTQGGVDVLVGEAVRKIPQEANPREQHVLVVGERAAGSRDKFELAYHETSAGDETNVETRDMLAAVTLGTGRTTTLVLNREYETAVAYSLLERTGPKRWRVRWTSATLDCDGGS
jgi:hypothetical protein